MCTTNHLILRSQIYYKFISYVSVEVLCRKNYHEHDDYGYDDPDGAAIFIVVIITLFAAGIAAFIAMTTLRKHKNDEWDMQG